MSNSWKFVFEKIKILQNFMFYTLLYVENHAKYLARRAFSLILHAHK